MRKLWTVIVGYGNRGQVYGDYALLDPEELGVAAVVDPSAFKREEAQKRYGLKDTQLFASFGEYAASGIACDFVINATMDELHYET